MTKPNTKNVELGQIPLLIRIGKASRLFGIGRPQLMGLVKSGKVRTVRLSPRGQHRFPTFELASALGMGDMVPRVGIPVNRDLLRNLEDEVRDAVSAAQAAFRHELRSELDQLRADLRSMIRDATQDRPPPRRVENRPLKSYRPQAAHGGAY